MKMAEWQKRIVDMLRRGPVTLNLPPQRGTVESAWRPPTDPALPETPRERFLRERAHRRKAINRTKNAVAKQARKVNRG
jgi:hypothetical protein